MTASTVISLDLGQAFVLTGALASAILGCVWWLIRQLGESVKTNVQTRLSSIERGSNEKFGSLEHVLATLRGTLDERMSAAESARAAHIAQNEAAFTTLREEQRRLEREFLAYKAEAERVFMRREDSIRDMTLIHAKLDGLASRVELLAQLVARHDAVTKEAR